MFRYKEGGVPVQMPRAGYRSGEKRVDVWLSSVQHAHLARLAEVEGCSLSDMVGSLIREKVMRDADGDAGSGDGRFAAADGGGPRDVPERGGSDHVGVGAGDVARPLTGQVWSERVRLDSEVGIDPEAARQLGLTAAERIEAMVDEALSRPKLTLVVNQPKGGCKSEIPSTLIGAIEPPLPFDAFESDTLPATRDPRGRLLSPIIRDDCIDVP
jgi:hypothetical protein